MTSKELIRRSVQEFYMTRGYMPEQIEVSKDLYEAYEKELEIMTVTPLPAKGEANFTGIPVVWRESHARLRD